MSRFLFLIWTATMPLEETRFEHTYKQSYDTSCGIEAMATLLGKFWGLDITAREVFLDMTSGLPQDAQGARAFPHDRGVAHGGAEGSMNGSATDIALPQTRKLAQSRNPRAPSFPKAFS